MDFRQKTGRFLAFKKNGHLTRTLFVFQSCCGCRRAQREADRRVGRQLDRILSPIFN